MGKQSATLTVIKTHFWLVIKASYLLLKSHFLISFTEAKTAFLFLCTCSEYIAGPLFSAIIFKDFSRSFFKLFLLVKRVSCLFFRINPWCRKSNFTRAGKLSHKISSDSFIFLSMGIFPSLSFPILLAGHCSFLSLFLFEPLLDSSFGSSGFDNFEPNLVLNLMGGSENNNHNR